MDSYPVPVSRLIEKLGKLPGIGRKSATRMAFHILHAPRSYCEGLSEAVMSVKNDIRLCKKCFNLSDDEYCNICRNPKRDENLVCVVEDPSDLIAIEMTGGYRGLYHVLHGHLDPLQGTGPDNLRIQELMLRLKTESCREVIIATNPDAPGTATALYLQKRLATFHVKITRLAQGIPVGGDIEFVDSRTLIASLKQRAEF